MQGNQRQYGRLCKKDEREVLKESAVDKNERNDVVFGGYMEKSV